VGTLHPLALAISGSSKSQVEKLKGGLIDPAQSDSTKLGLIKAVRNVHELLQP